MPIDSVLKHLRPRTLQCTEALLAARRALGQRVRVYYSTRVARHDGVEYSVWGDNEANVDASATAHAVVRILHVGSTHVLVKPDNQPRPVAIHANSLLRVASVLLTERG